MKIYHPMLNNAFLFMFYKVSYNKPMLQLMHQKGSAKYFHFYHFIIMGYNELYFR